MIDYLPAVKTGFPTEFSFLDASSHLYERVCPSVGPSVRRSVRYAFQKRGAGTRLLRAALVHSGLMFDQPRLFVAQRWKNVSSEALDHGGRVEGNRLFGLES